VVALGGDLSFGVEGGSGGAEGEGSDVFFVLVKEGVCLAGEGFADEEDHHAVCEGIEGAGMANFADVGFFAQSGDEAKGGFARWFVYR